MQAIMEKLQTAASFHQRGSLVHAEQLYREVLQADPSQADAWHLLGVLTSQVGDFDVGLECINKAIALNPRTAEFHVSLGEVHRSQGRLEQATKCYQQALKLEPNSAAAHCNLGCVYLQENRFGEAENSLNAALRAQPRLAAAHNNLGSVFLRQGKLIEATNCFQRAIVCQPELADAQHNLGQVYQEQGEWDRAEACYRQAMSLQPQMAMAHAGLAFALLHQGKPKEAHVSFETALGLQPDLAVAHDGLGTLYLLQDRFADAIVCFERALRIQPDLAEAHNNLGNALQGLGKMQEAIASFQQALQLRPNSVVPYNNLGNAYREIGQLEYAETYCKESLRLQPHQPETHGSLGNVFFAQGKYKEAETCYREAVRLRPALADAHYNLGNALKEQGRFDEAKASYLQAGIYHQEGLIGKYGPAEASLNQAMLLLKKGDFEKGWREFECRWQCREFAVRSFSQPRWDGSSLEHRRILLQAEQGLGDIIQFVRYADLIKEHGGHVIVEGRPPLKTLLASCPGVDEVVLEGGTLPAFDVYAPLMSLPGILRTTLDTIPAQVPYLFPDQVLVERWREKLAKISGFKVGIAWQGNPSFRWNRWRSMPLEQLAPISEVRGVTLISLQKAVGAEQIRALEKRFEVFDLGAEMQDDSWSLMDTAAVMMNLDLVVSTDTAVPHLAGALAIQAWLLLHAVPDWRWLLEREDSPWYPTMRLFRQTQLGDWADVVQNVRLALEQLVAQRVRS